MEKHYNINGFKQGQVVKINDNRNSRYSFLCNEKYIGRELTIDYFMYILSEYYVCFKEIPNDKFYYFSDLFEDANNDKKESVIKYIEHLYDYAEYLDNKIADIENQKEQYLLCLRNLHEYIEDKKKEVEDEGMES